MSSNATSDKVSWLVSEFPQQDSVSNTDLGYLSEVFHQDQWSFTDQNPFQSKRNLELFPTSRQQCRIVGP